ncbi:DHS-like NAD/FAD-binding domain-containing protein [Stachybotrys elegans]|uniref:DHS-like NAD/FAD-binding domain-containing protein n=1 Tax=Stachybotrys elegans TaxID=80388 RepID=A0A8K0WPR5_9HYPO|nr:DHS-like NAD/FAD-binding domain-containing protein [Stachybotrys elegans]
MGQEESMPIDDSVPPRTLSDRSLAAVADYIKSGNVRRIVVLTGAGISTAAGIPDFRSPKTGLYHNLARLDLPYAEAVFDISYFRNKPEPFYVLAKELYPGKFFPTVSHAFIALLAQKGLLLRLFTQNIDCLERSAGVPGDKIIEAHGSFATQRCIDCKQEFPDEDMKTHVLNGKVPRCQNSECNGLVKPDIVFFGEPLPSAFNHNAHQTALADLVLIIGTSLTVYPFASLPDMAERGKPRLLFNMERVGQIGTRTDDVVELGPCDDGIRKLADLLGWRDELEELWRGIVGDKEAERQLESQAEHEHEVEEEVQKLTEEIKATLNLEESDTEEKPVATEAEAIGGDVGSKLGEKQEAKSEPADSIQPQNAEVKDVSAPSEELKKAEEKPSLGSSEGKPAQQAASAKDVDREEESAKTTE